MDIQALHLENNAYRDMITSLKRQIVEYDQRIQANESEIGRQLSDMQKYPGSCLSLETLGHPRDCELCMGECDADGV